MPPDVRDSESEVEYFLEHLTSDAEFVAATRRELDQCAGEVRVESVKGDQETRAAFVLLPLEDLKAGEGGSLDIVREVAFVSADGGVTWTAEVRFETVTPVILSMIPLGLAASPSYECPRQSLDSTNAHQLERQLPCVEIFIK